MASQKQVAETLRALCDAFNDKDAERAASLFVFPVKFTAGEGVIERADTAALVAQFRAQLAEHAAGGVAGYRIRLGEVAASGETAAITADWTHRRLDGEAGGSATLRYLLHRTPEGWRIAGAETVDTP